MIISNIIDKILITKIKNSPNINIGDFLELTNIEQKQYQKYQQLLSNNYPLDYIVGYVDINGLRFFVEEGVFIPRPCTEELVKLVQTNSNTIIDICAGSGFIGLSLAKKFPTKTIILVENSTIACKSILKSIEYNKLCNIKIFQQDALKLNYSQFEDYIIVCNPPYVPDAMIYDSVKYEPKKAIYSGSDGLTFFNKLITMLATNLPNQIYLELDPSNIEQANHILINDYTTSIIQDLENFPRFLIGK